MVVALRVDLRLLQVERLVQRGELAAQRARSARSAPAPAARPRSLALVVAAELRLELLRAAHQLLDAQVARRQLALRQHRLLARRRRAGPRARWPGRGCVPSSASSRRRSSSVAGRGSAELGDLGPRARLRTLLQGLDVAPQLDQLAQLQLDLLLVGRRPSARAAASSRSSSAARHLRLAGLAARISSSVRCSQRLVAVQRRPSARPAGRASASLSPRSAESIVAIEEGLLQVGVDPGHGAAQLGRRVLLEPELRGQVLDLALQAAAPPRLRPCSSWPRKNWASTNTTSRKMIDSSSVDSASTKPGQMSTWCAAVAPGARHRPSPRPPAARRRRWRSCARPA